MEIDMSVTLTITVKEGVIHWLPETQRWVLVTGRTHNGKWITKPIPERLKKQLDKYNEQQQEGTRR
jgi:hypothetical protein